MIYIGTLEAVNTFDYRVCQIKITMSMDGLYVCRIILDRPSDGNRYLGPRTSQCRCV